MHQELEEFIREEKTHVSADEEIMDLENVVKTFNSCCDEIKRNEGRTASMTREGSQYWRDEQDRMWETAKAGFRRNFNFDNRPPIQLVSLINEFADTWRAQKAAEHDNQVARDAATISYNM